MRNRTIFPRKNQPLPFLWLAIHNQLRAAFIIGRSRDRKLLRFAYIMRVSRFPSTCELEALFSFRGNPATSDAFEATTNRYSTDDSEVRGASLTRTRSTHVHPRDSREFFSSLRNATFQPWFRSNED